MQQKKFFSDFGDFLEGFVGSPSTDYVYLPHTVLQAKRVHSPFRPPFLYFNQLRTLTSTLCLLTGIQQLEEFAMHQCV